MTEDNIDRLFAGVRDFEWDEAKSKVNLAKHCLDFDEAKEVFYDQITLRRSDRNNEERWIAVGLSHGRIVAVIFTRRNDCIRIISARRARNNEERAYRHAEMGRSEKGQD